MSETELVRLSELGMERVAKRYGSIRAVRDVSLSVGPGELYTLLGPAASGKSTLLRMIAGLVRPDTGRILVDGEPIDAVPPSERRIGMVFQQGALWPHMSVFDNVAFGLRARRVPAAEIARKVHDALGQVRFEGSPDRRPPDLPLAEQHRVALARTLVTRPRLLLLDDPLSNLDPVVRAHMRLELRRIQRELGITTMHATRDQAEALAVSTRVAVLSDGRLVQEGKPDEVYWRPRSRFVAEFVGAANLVPVRVVELREIGVVVETGGGARLPVASGGHVWRVGATALLCLRPESLRVEEAALAPGGIPGMLVGQEFEGARQIYEVDIGPGTLRIETLTSPLRARALKPGDDVKVEVSPESSVLLPDDDGDAGT